MKFKSLVSAAALLTAIGISSAAHANLFVQVGPGPDQTTSNVLVGDQTATRCLNPLNCGAAATIEATLNNAPGNIFFTSTSDALRTQGGGQARIEAQEGELDQLSITAGPAGQFVGFEAITLNINADAGDTIQFTVADQFGVEPLQGSSGAFTLSQGENFFRFSSDANQFFTLLSFTATGGVTVGVDDVRQVRVGALVPIPGPIAGAGLPALLALGGFVWARRRKAAGAALPA